ncbi:dihydrofolate reductase family protein [Micromonospora sp. KC723]|uniref:dihydrofolate reductase family protein n=1 Tax=Micromonospora sp. KC723 TaxID=2530381 RepID=UPI001051E848|nr:dihydrofolate reductase family protein [Micromonospora sp. KC723]TDB78463.1 dihydrofolate reductase [Micromonospora sp. KC723]
MELIVHAFISLDGVMQGPAGAEEDSRNTFERGGWLVPHSDAGQLSPVEGWMAKADAILLGRTTFEVMRRYWQQVTDPHNLVATVLNRGRKYVVSNTLSDSDAAWGNTTVLRGDIIEQVRRVKEQPGGELQVHGSWQLARALHDAGLVDTYRLLQVPVFVGEGKRLFADGGIPATYRITESQTLNKGAGALSLVLRQAQFGTIGTGEFVVREGQEAIA